MKKKKRKRSKGKSKPRKEKLPFIIHADPLKELTAFPTHTHGLREINMPEMFIDPVSFGPNGNASIINHAYEYFRRPKNQGKLKAILEGEIIKLESKELSLGRMGNYTFCFREVSPDFEGAKLSYSSLHDLEGNIAGFRIVQIWVEGDDFALEDDYYVGGVRW